VLDDRRFVITGMSRLAVRVAYTVDRAIAPDEVVGWREQGLSIVAAAIPGEPTRPPTSVADGLQPGTEIVLAGPEDVLRTCLFG
jgi:hypothetical protein